MLPPHALIGASQRPMLASSSSIFTHPFERVRGLAADDLFRLQDDGHRYELLDGGLVEMAPTGGKHGRASAKVAQLLLNHVEPDDLGEVLSNEPGIVLQRNPDRVRAPDVCFIARHRVPAEELPGGYLDSVPDLIVEVISPTDRATEGPAKIEEWLRAGARLVWAVFPNTRSVVAYQSFTDIGVTTETDTLDGAPVLPGFACPVTDPFSHTILGICGQR